MRTIRQIAGAAATFILLTGLCPFILLILALWAVFGPGVGEIGEVPVPTEDGGDSEEEDTENM